MLDHSLHGLVHYEITCLPPHFLKMDPSGYALSQSEIVKFRQGVT